MFDRKNTIAPRQWALLVAAAIALVLLCVVVGMTLFGQASEGPAANTTPAVQSDNEGGSSEAVSAPREDAAEVDSDAEEQGEAGGESDEVDDGSSETDSSSSEPGSAVSGGGNSAPSGGSQTDPESQPTPAPATITVFVAIDATKGGGGHSSQSVVVNEGSSVYDALRATGASISGNSTYVRSINGLAEFQAGPNSGWYYYVDGVKPNYSCGNYILSGGENITWLYVDDYTKYR